MSFTPAPTGEEGRSDLISIVKRFGLPLYTLFLPSMVRSHAVTLRFIISVQLQRKLELKSAVNSATDERESYGKDKSVGRSRGNASGFEI